MISSRHNSMARQVQFRGIDVTKFIMAFAVIVIHVASVTMCFDKLSAATRWFVCLAVPFYFICSGYLFAFFNSTTDKKRLSEKAMGRSKKLFRLFFYWILIYLPISIFIYAIRDTAFISFWGDYLKDIIVFGKTCYAWPLWFIYSMAIVFFIISITISRKRLFVFACVVMISVPLITWCYETAPSNVLRVVHGLTCNTLGGGIYILTGMACRRFEGFVKNRFCLASLLAISILLFMFDLPYWELSGGMAIFGFAISILPSNAMSKSESQPQNEKIFLWLRNMSSWIYYLHMYPIFIILYSTMLCTSHTADDLSMWPMFIATSAIVTVVSAALIYGANRFTSLSPLKRLIGL